MSEQPLVSIITPCYNGETYVHRYFESILAQAYPRIEVYFVNDGSTDRTEEIALRYKEKLEGRGISMTYIYQENAGQAAAVNRALPLFQGEYLTWPDSDDWMSPDCIEKKVRYLEEHPEKGFVLCKSAVVSEDQLDRAIGVLQRKNTASGWIFEDLLEANDIYYAPVGWMARAKALLEVLPDRSIYTGGAGQNAQLLMPLAYRYECGFIDEILAFYLVRANSHSRSGKGFQDANVYAQHTQDILDHVLNGIPMPEEERRSWLQKARVRCIRMRFHAAAQFHEPDALKEEYQNLALENAVTPEDRQTYLKAKYRCFAWAYWLFRLPGRIVGKIKRMAAGRP